ncbi:MAG: DUF3299 domain-containing protein [Opitutaceae bacterium]|nr:DUF3299 domain-containing protein [Opitutaceae bacterium]
MQSCWPAFLALLAPAFGAPASRGPLDHAVCCGPGAFNPANHDPFGVPAKNPRRLPSPTRNADDTAANTPPTAASARPVLRIPGPPLADLERPLVRQSGYAKIGFSQLAAFPFQAPETPLAPGTTPPDLLAQVPAVVRKLDGEKVVLTGFMLPTKLKDGFATEFLFLSSSQLCCFGTQPALNDWIAVKMRGEGLPPVQDVPMSLAGRLRIQPQWIDGVLTALYTMEGHGLLKTKD